MAAISYDPVSVRRISPRGAASRSHSFPIRVADDQETQGSSTSPCPRQSADLRHPVSRHLHAERARRRHVAVLRAGLSGAEYRREHARAARQPDRRAGHEDIVAPDRDHVVCDGYHRGARNALLPCARCTARARHPRLCAWVSGYKPIALAVEPQPWVVVKGAQYPAPEDYHFKPLNEHVKVYQQPFRIAQDVALDASTEAQAALKDVSSLTLKGHADLSGVR